MNDDVESGLTMTLWINVHHIFYYYDYGDCVMVEDKSKLIYLWGWRFNGIYYTRIFWKVLKSFINPFIFWAVGKNENLIAKLITKNLISLFFIYMCMISNVWIDEPLTPLSHSISFYFLFYLVQILLSVAFLFLCYITSTHKV